MADVNIGAQLTLDTGQSFQNLKQLQDHIKQTKKELTEAKYGSEEYAKAQDRLKKATALLNPEVDKQGGAMDALKKQVHGIIPGFGAATDGATGFGSALKALLVNPIVLIIAAIVAGLKFLYEAFKSTAEGAHKVEQVFDGLKAIMQVLYDRIMSFGTAIIKLFSGDFSGAFKDAKASVTGLSEAIETAYTKAAAITKRLQELKKEQREDDVDRSRRERDLALLREQLNDESVPIQKRLAAAKALREEQIKNSADDLRRTTEISNLKIERLKMERDGEHKNADEIAELQKAIYETQKENAMEGIRTNKVVRNLEKQQATERKAEIAELKAAEKARIEELRNYQNKLQQLKQEYNIFVADEDEKGKIQIENRRANEKRSLQLELEEKKITHAQYTTLVAALDKVTEAQLADLKEKQNKKTADKEKAFQKELSGIQEETTVQGAINAREKERAALEKTFADKRQQVLDNEKYTAEQKDFLLQALALQSRATTEAMEKKFKSEDEAKEKEYNLKRITLREAFLNAQKKKDFSALRTTLDEKEQLQNEYYLRDLAEAEGNAQRKMDLEQKHAEDTQALTLARIKLSSEERAAREADAAAVGGALGALSDLIGQQTVVGKGLAIASALINTYLGATKALAQGGLAGIASAIIVTAAGLKSVQAIVNTKIPGGGSGAGSVSASPSAPLQPSPQVTNTTLNPDQINQIGNAAASRAFVLESDVENNRERIIRLNRAARIA